MIKCNEYILIKGENLEKKEIEKSIGKETNKLVNHQKTGIIIIEFLDEIFRVVVLLWISQKRWKTN